MKSFIPRLVDFFTGGCRGGGILDCGSRAWRRRLRRRRRTARWDRARTASCTETGARRQRSSATRTKPWSRLCGHGCALARSTGRAEQLAISKGSSTLDANSTHICHFLQSALPGFSERNLPVACLFLRDRPLVMCLADLAVLADLIVIDVVLQNTLRIFENPRCAGDVVVSSAPATFRRIFQARSHESYPRHT